MKAAFNVYDITNRNKFLQHVNTLYLHQVDFCQILKFNCFQFDFLSLNLIQAPPSQRQKQWQQYYKIAATVYVCYDATGRAAHLSVLESVNHQDQELLVLTTSNT